MAESLTLLAQARDETIKPKALRRSGIVPGVVYGHQFPSVSLQFPEPTLRRLLSKAGTTHLVNLVVPESGLSETVLIRDVQRHPVSGALLHVDLYRIVADQPITTAVPVRAHGEAPAIVIGGVVNMLLDEIEVECLPRDLPDHISVDLSVLTHMDSAIFVRDLPIPGNVTVLTDADTPVARIVAPRGAEEAEAGEAEEAEEPEETSEE